MTNNTKHHTHYGQQGDALSLGWHKENSGSKNMLFVKIESHSSKLCVRTLQNHGSAWLHIDITPQELLDLVNKTLEEPQEECHDCE